MPSLLARSILPDVVTTFPIRPEMFRAFIDARQEGGPRLKCYEGSVTLVSPGRSHETIMRRLFTLVSIALVELEIKHTALGSTTQALPDDARATAYEPDDSYYLQSFGTTRKNHPPDLAIEVVVTNPATKALLAGAALGIGELWVLDIPRNRLTFYHLATRGKYKGTNRPRPSSRAVPTLRPADILERLDDPEPDHATFHKQCRAWARDVLAPRGRGRR